MEVLSYENEVIDEALPDDPRLRIAVTIRTSKSDPDTGDPKLDDFIRTARDVRKSTSVQNGEDGQPEDGDVQSSEVIQ